jgi:LacI family transcriptional regulator
MTRLPKKISLVAQTAVALREAISLGRWKRLLPGEHELASQLHVGRRTVRAALNQLCSDGVVKCCHGKRREIINQHLVRLPPASSRIVFLTPVPLQTLSPFAIFIIDRLREHLAEEGYLLEIHSGRVPYRAPVTNHLKNLAETLDPAGWVLSQSTEPMQRWFHESGLPCVVAGSCYPEITLPSVDTDFGAICRHAVGQFLARGHRQLVLLNPNPGAAGDLKAEAGFHEALQKTRAQGVTANIVNHDGTPANICARLNGLMQSDQPPTAFLVSRAQHVLTVLGHLLSCRFRIPQDVAVISRDDESFLENVVPTVARYSRNPDVFASTLSRMVLEVVHGKPVMKEHKIMPSFVLGQTLGRKEG